MIEHDFQRNLARAEILGRLALDPEEVNFWIGYMHGLRRFYYGENFGTEEDHARFITAYESFHQAEKMLGLGYQVGLIGQNIHKANFLLHA